MFHRFHRSRINSITTQDSFDKIKIENIGFHAYKWRVWLILAHIIRNV